MKNIAIIGAGLAGLTAANVLKDLAHVTLFEKSRGTGGRMATRRNEAYHFDHGAQFFKAKTSAFINFLSPMIEKNIIKRWDARFIEFDGNKITKQQIWSDKPAHYVGSPHMNAVGKYLAQDLNISLNTRIQTMAKENHQWRLIDDKGNEQGAYDWVISAVPAPQALDILPPQTSFYQDLTSVNMKACFSLMLGFNDPLPVSFDAALVRGMDISWISVNSTKPERPPNFTLLVHSTNKWAQTHIDDDPLDVIDYLCQQASKVIGLDVKEAEHKAIHGWRYANIEKQAGNAYLIDMDNKLGTCGDWLIQGRVEAAFTSGYTIAHKIREAIEDA